MRRPGALDGIVASLGRQVAGFDRALTERMHRAATADGAFESGAEGSVEGAVEGALKGAVEAEAAGHARNVAGSGSALDRFAQDTGEELPPPTALDAAERRHAAGLMRIDHIGEVCAQALYRAHALTARSAEMRAFYEQAGEEEKRHLDWTAGRLDELGSQTSPLAPAWYAASFAIGLGAGLTGDRQSLGFMAETERQVERHLNDHLASLPEQDARSRAILRRMRDEEVGHADEAVNRGGRRPPHPARIVMRWMSRVMTTTAYRF